MAPVRTPVRCAIYTRQSVDSHDNLSSCQVQFDLCRAYVLSQNGLGYVLVDDRFDDEGCSGTTLERPSLQRLLELVQSGGVDRVVIYRLDRLSRSLAHFVVLARMFKENDVELTIVVAPGMGVAAIDHLMVNMLASFAEFEREMTASRIAETRAYLKANGRRIAGVVPFGYSADRRTKQLVVVPEEAEIARRMFDWALEKINPATIASTANTLGWRTGNGNRWTAWQVLFTISNHVYAGLIVDGYGYRDGCHTGLVEQKAFHQVQSILAGRKTPIPAAARSRYLGPSVG